MNICNIDLDDFWECQNQYIYTKSGKREFPFNDKHIIIYVIYIKEVEIPFWYLNTSVDIKLHWLLRSLTHELKFEFSSAEDAKSYIDDILNSYHKMRVFI